MIMPALVGILNFTRFFRLTVVDHYDFGMRQRESLVVNNFKIGSSELSLWLK